ncbi:hypothetical protein A2767_05815 [Candidatus Roizmanbacteria bacterium RIFCSPHIGHO2_01_FULL_35_10]|uniref:Glycosyl transferase family 1 domain-containing protein n=1 Tax=Candidatus Roizmanbacteria bacterium RIFCSPLOWO2_01_FULL_35_13 TaxID=1802055 RepID=A0A1F7I6X0_9BACT|nr:MAG: hypothetical protein A2767_05815 [Candidatus Roizmanbacteria bacterium RIFCSPHIGHO2_01_FULL_35_10]OGK39105.1 MAG: hypothetical protein A3A74_05775 [Candidatus Roizmanbacteria bacterium RIFCSPLOWO2_01_FULL_35_13]
MIYNINKIAIATHHLVYGAPQALKDYLVSRKITKLLYISHPLFVDNTKSFFEVIVKSKVQIKKQWSFRLPISILNYPLELLLTIFWVVKQKEKYDIFIGVDNLNAFAGIILKKLGLVKKVIYYTIDFVPKRFTYPPLDNLYHWADALCLKYADETWNVSPRISEAREKFKGLRRSLYNRQKIVPIGVWTDKIKKIPFANVKKHQLLYLGSLVKKQGVQLIISVIPDIIKKIKDFHFLIIGGGSYESALQRLAIALKVEKHITFKGWVKNRKLLDSLLSDSALAVAMYRKESDNYSYFADPTKLKDYLSAGLPIIMTNVPHSAPEIVKNQCGTIINYSKEDLKKALLKYLTDEEMLKTYRQNALRYIKKFDWNIIFGRSLNPLL